jgi:hypothetical protein
MVVAPIVAIWYPSKQLHLFPIRLPDPAIQPPSELLGQCEENLCGAYSAVYGLRSSNQEHQPLSPRELLLLAPPPHIPGTTNYLW